MSRVVVYHGNAHDIERFDAPEGFTLEDKAFIYVERGDDWWLAYDRDNDAIGSGTGLHKPRNWRG